MTEQKRSKLIDVFKGIAIIGVVYTHTFVMPYSGAKPLGEVAENPSLFHQNFLNLFYTALYLFFPASKLFYKGTTVQKTRMRLLSLALFYVFFSFVALLISFAYALASGMEVGIVDTLQYYLKNFFGSNSLHPFKGYFSKPHPVYGPQLSPFYFLSLMFFADAIFYAVEKIALQSVKNLAFWVFVLCSASAVLYESLPVHLPWMMEVTPVLAATMLISAYAGKMGALQAIESGWKNWKLWIVWLGSLILVLEINRYAPIGMLASANLGAYKGLSAYIGCAAILSQTFVGLFLLSPLVLVPFISDGLNWIGKRTLVIFTLHSVVIAILGHFFGVETSFARYGWKWPIEPIPPFWQSALILIGGIALSILIGVVVQKPLALLLKKISGAMDGKSEKAAPGKPAASESASGSQ